MFKKSQYLKKSAAHRQLTKLANAAQVIRVNRRLAKKAGAGMGDVVANAHSKPAAAGPQKPAPAYTPLAGRHPRRPKPVAKQPSEPIDLVIPHTNPLQWKDLSLQNILTSGFAPGTRWNEDIKRHAPYYGWDAKPGFYMMQAPFLGRGDINGTGSYKYTDILNKNKDHKYWGFGQWCANQLSVPGVNHSFLTAVLDEAQWKTLPAAERRRYTYFPREGKSPLYARQVSSANAERISEESTNRPESSRLLYWLFQNHPGGTPLHKMPGEWYDLHLPGAGHINYIARAPLVGEEYANNAWNFTRLPNESDAEWNARYALAINNAANAAAAQIRESPDYTMLDANCHLGTMNGLLNNPYIIPVRGSTGGIEGASGTTGSLADTKWFTPFTLYTAADDEVTEAAKGMPKAQRNRARKKQIRRDWGIPGVIYSLFMDN
ncbi:MAG: hypothetical protein IJV70_07470 [Clostridia bacterium]|nr:hypothetical protein [Clostridia bacterium]